MFEQYIGKLIVLEYHRRGETTRFICRMLKEENGFITIESPTKKEQSIVALSAIIELSELPQGHIRPEKLTP